MNKRLSYLGLALLCLFGGQSAWAQEFTQGNFTYTVRDGDATAVTIRANGENKPTGSVVIPSKVTNEGTTYTVTEVGSEGFSGCGEMTSLTIPASIVDIDEYYCFGGCSNLSSVTFEDSPVTLNVKGNTLFYGTEKVNSLYLGRNITHTGDGNIFGQIENVVLGNQVTTIKDYFFGGNTALESVTIPSSVTTVEGAAFRGCSSLASVDLSSITQTTLPDLIFRDCSSMTECILPSTITHIGYESFEGCSSLKSLTIPASVTTINEYYCFSGCSGLTDVVFEDSDTPLVIDGNALFLSSINLNKLYIGRNITHINSSSDVILGYGKNITIGEKVTALGDILYDYEGQLQSVTVKQLNPFTLAEGVFTEEQLANATLWIPGGTDAAYTDAGWNFTNVDHTSFVVTMSTNAGGALKTGTFIASEGNNVRTLIDRESNVLFEIQKEQDYDFTSLTKNGNAVEVVDGKYTIPSLLEDVNMVATFTIKPLLNITASATNGTATPSAAQVYRDRDAYVTFAANEGHELTAVTLNEADVLAQVADNRLNLTNIQANQNVVATFTLIHYTVSTAATENGTITLAATDVQWGNGTTATITPATGYDIDHVTINGENADNKLEGNILTISDVKANTVVGATFKKHAYTISAAATTNGTIVLASTSVLYQEGTTATITPATGYDIDHVTINGENADAQLNGNTLTISNVTANVTVGATFKKHAYTISAAATTNGTIELAATSVLYQEGTTATITPAAGYQINEVTLNGTDAKSQLSGTTLTINNVTENIEVGATFKLIEYTVSITGAGVTADKMNPKHGESVTFTIAVDPDRTLTSFLVNSVEHLGEIADNQYTVNNVTSDITVVATFASTKEFITIGSLGVGTYACSQDLDFTGSDLQAYIAVGFNKTSGSVILSRVYDVPAGTGIYLKGAEGTHKVPYATTSCCYVNMLVGNTGNQITLAQVTGAMGNYYLGEDNGTPKFFLSDGTATVGQNRAYLQIPLSFFDPRTNNAPVSIQFEEEVTGMEDIIFFGQQENNLIYNLNGQRMNKMGSGIHIINGKKVINR